jgi:hypothetical protein
MKYLSWTLIVIGLATILFGFVSCNHAANASDAGRAYTDSEGDATPFIVYTRFIYTTGAAAIIVSLGLYLRTWARPEFSISRLAAHSTILYPRFCPKCGKPLRCTDCDKFKSPGFISRLVCRDCGVPVEYSGARVFAVAVILTVCSFLISSFGMNYNHGVIFVLAIIAIFSIPIGLILCLISFFVMQRQFSKGRQYFSMPPKLSDLSKPFSPRDLQ